MLKQIQGKCFFFSIWRGSHIPYVPAKADALWNTVGNISISSPIQNVEQKKNIFFVKRFLVTQWKSCDLWLLCLDTAGSINH